MIRISLFIVLIFLFMNSCVEKNISTNKSQEIDLVNSLDLYKSTNYNLRSGNTSFIVFGISETDTVKLKFDIEIQEKGLTNDLANERKQAYAELKETRNEFNLLNTIEEMDSLLDINRDALNANMMGSMVIQETGIIILFEIVEISTERNLTKNELQLSKKYVHQLNEYNFPDVIFLFKAIGIAKDQYTDEELNALISNIKENSRIEIENCKACFVKGEKSELERARETFFLSQKAALEITY